MFDGKMNEWMNEWMNEYLREPTDNYFSLFR